MSHQIPRRRFLAIAAAGAMAAGRAGAATAFWRGRALGAEASITLGGTGRARAEDTLGAVTAELERLEDIFSLYRASFITRLNRDGHLDAPPADLVDLLQLCAEIHGASGGAFDPTIQAVWQLMTKPSCAEASETRAAWASVGWDGVTVSRDRIAFARPGMSITLNGIAQGYITDRVAAVLAARSFGDVLVDMGEVAAQGSNHGAPWSADLARPDGRSVGRVSLRDRCLAVSAPGGAIRCTSGHILDPRSGGALHLRKLAAVSANSAALADGLSTACCLLDDGGARALVARFDGAALETLS